MSFQPSIAIPPGDTIMELLEERDIHFYKLAAALIESEPVTLGLLNGTVRIDRQMAAKLASFFAVPAAFWLNLEKQYNETLLRLWDEPPQEAES